MSLLEVVGLEVLGLAPFDLSVEGGECLGFSGPSGSGKTLTLRALADLDPHGGEVRLAGRPSTSYLPSQWRAKVGYLPAESAWWDERVGAHFAAADEAQLKALGFPPGVLSWSVERCSTGERQRLALLRLLQNRPDVLLLDEPTASLDEQSIERVEALLARERARGAAIIWVSHSPEQLARVADRRIVIRGGRLEAHTP